MASLRTDITKEEYEQFLTIATANRRGVFYTPSRATNPPSFDVAELDHDIAIYRHKDPQGRALRYEFSWNWTDATIRQKRSRASRL